MAARLFFQYVYLFNETLTAQLSAQNLLEKIVYVDASQWFADTVKNYRENGFVVANQQTACSASKIIFQAKQLGLVAPEAFIQENGVAILCSAATLVESNAEKNYMFADDFHPTTRLHELFARFVEQRIEASGILSQ